jgi:predicted nucleic acid-binding Zn ribbon protein
MRRRKALKSPAHIKTIIPHLMKSYRNQGDTEMVKIFGIWEKAVGVSISKHAQPEAFKGKLLLVNVTDSTWMHQLQFLKKDILAKLNAVMGQHRIEEIRFRIGPI